ncbi:MAG: glycosyltransferase family 4 protein, partial [Planctomycetota bacterium]|nr:glycosyltransferase family 4 protein [Planctomycetota bacterium]
LKSRAATATARLRIAGVMLREDEPFVDELRVRLRDAGCLEDVEFLPNLDRSQKIAFLASLTVLSVPARYGESFGLYLLEAMATGVPVVQPRHAAFPELLAATGGGLLCEPEDPRALADGLAELLEDPAQAAALGAKGRDAVRAKFTSRDMAGNVAELCRELVTARMS